MRRVVRAIEPTLLKAARAFPAIVVTGPRRSGKTYLLKALYPRASYQLFEDPDVIARFRSDPRGFLDSIRTPAIFDEVQNVPEVFSYVRARIDGAPVRHGQYLLTGSNEFGLMSNVSESMAGRAAVLQLLPLSVAESSRVSLLRGGYPEVVARPASAPLWFSSYLQTYLERDVRSITAVHDLPLFRRFLGLVASRHGQILNKTDLAAPLGLSVPSITRWLDILEATGLVFVVQPYFDNLGKRLIKSPKIYISDSGLACHLLGIQSRRDLDRSPFRGALFEGAVAAEIIKRQINSGHRRELYYFRDQTGLEVDFLVPERGGDLHLIEAKATATVMPAMAAPMLKLAAAWRAAARPRGAVRMTVIHDETRSAIDAEALAPGVQARGWRNLRP